MGFGKLSTWILIGLCLHSAIAQAEADDEYFPDRDLSDAIHWNPANHQIDITLGPPVLFPISAPGNSSPGDQIPPHERATLSADVGNLVTGNNRFALDIYRRLLTSQDKTKNVLVSPLSISTALGMTYAGARGRTAEQMADVLGFTLPADRLHPSFGELIDDLDATREGYELSIANRLFAQENFDFHQPFLDITSGPYQAPVESLDFIHNTDQSRRRINHWVEEKTNNKIRDLLPDGSLSRDTRLVLTNAIYFDGRWKSKFDENLTHDASFYATDGGVSTVEMMFQRETFRYGDFDGFKMLEMPYAGDDLSMVLMLPDAADGLPDFEASLTTELLDQSLAAMSQRKTQVYLPKFKFEASFQLGETLQDMGMTDAFRNADFSGMADGGLAIKDVLHKAYIDVNEAGTEAAAATAVIIEATSVCYCKPTPPPVFRADHPFLFALRDTHSGSLMFLGRVAQPGESVIAETASHAVPEPASLAVAMSGLFWYLLGRRSRSHQAHC